MLWAKWKRFAIVVGADSAFVVAASQLASRRQQAEMHILPPLTVNIESGPLVAEQLDVVRTANLRVAFVIANSSDVLRVALAAYRQGMLVEGWAWLGLDTVAGAEMSAIDGLESTEAAKTAMHGWVYFVPNNAAPATFFDNATTATHANFPHQHGSASQLDALSTPFAANMYDAVMLYAMAVGRNSSERLNRRPLVLAMMNISFDGMTGKVELDENGDMKESIQAVNYFLGKDGAMHSKMMGLFDGHQYSAVRTSSVIWPGGAGTTPVDSAPAETASTFNTAWLLAAAGAVTFVVVGGLFAFVRKRHAQLQALMMMIFTEALPASRPFPRPCPAAPAPPLYFPSAAKPPRAGLRIGFFRALE